MKLSRDEKQAVGSALSGAGGVTNGRQIVIGVARVFMSLALFAVYYWLYRSGFGAGAEWATGAAVVTAGAVWLP